MQCVLHGKTFGGVPVQRSRSSTVLYSAVAAPNKEAVHIEYVASNLEVAAYCLWKRKQRLFEKKLPKKNEEKLCRKQSCQQVQLASLQHA